MYNNFVIYIASTVFDQKHLQKKIVIIFPVLAEKVLNTSS